MRLCMLKLTVGKGCQGIKQLFRESVAAHRVCALQSSSLYMHVYTMPVMKLEGTQALKTYIS